MGKNNRRRGTIVEVDNVGGKEMRLGSTLSSRTQKTELKAVNNITFRNLVSTNAKDMDKKGPERENRMMGKVKGKKKVG